MQPVQSPSTQDQKDQENTLLAFCVLSHYITYSSLNSLLNVYPTFYSLMNYKSIIHRDLIDLIVNSIIIWWMPRNTRTFYMEGGPLIF